MISYHIVDHETLLDLTLPYIHIYQILIFIRKKGTDLDYLGRLQLYIHTCIFPYLPTYLPTYLS
jgi:hypothetical protein